MMSSHLSSDLLLQAMTAVKYGMIYSLSLFIYTHAVLTFKLPYCITGSYQCNFYCAFNNQPTGLPKRVQEGLACHERKGQGQALLLQSRCFEVTAYLDSEMKRFDDRPLP